MHDVFARSRKKFDARRLFPWTIVTILLFAGAVSTARTGDMISTLYIGSARIDIVTEADSGLPMDELLRWVKMAAESVAGYYGHFPVSRLTIQVTPFRGSGVRHGMTFGTAEGGRITIRVGVQTSPAEFAEDWMLTHEMIHLSFPSMADQHHWIEEGIATYVEPIARIRAGQLTPERMWSDLVRDMPKGQPEEGDRGLDHTHTWGRTYWGGAIFCLQADVEIRRQTKNAKGLEHALRAVLVAGGDIRQDWEISKALQLGDRATGTSALEDLYERMKDKPLRVDLDALWKELGVRADGKEVRFDDTAPFAAIRRAIAAAAAPSGQSFTSERLVTVFAGRARSASSPW